VKPADCRFTRCNHSFKNLISTQEQYRELQQLGNFDTKTSSWVKTSPDIRKLGGASLLISATALSSFITTVRNHTMLPGASVAHYGFKCCTECKNLDLVMKNTIYKDKLGFTSGSNC